MTRNQIAYWEYRENQRANRAREKETARANRVNERETNRANLARETETNRNNLVVSAETNRSNLAREAETHRNNLISEAIAQGHLDETVRHNTTVETETERNNRQNNAIGWSQAAAAHTSAAGALLRGQSSMLQAREGARHNQITEQQNLANLRENQRVNDARIDLMNTQATTAKHGAASDYTNSMIGGYNARTNRLRAFNEAMSGIGNLGLGIFKNIGIGGLIQ